MESKVELNYNTPIIEALDIHDITLFISKKNRKYQAILLHDIEEAMGKDNEEYPAVRKLVLDAFNNYTRAIMRIIFGNDFEI
jgi:hypothetical protein